MTDKLKQYVQQITMLPTLPVVAQEILRLVNDELVAVDKLENIIENDPPISAKIISVSNSAFFGYKTHTTTVKDAILRIGLNNVRDVALGVSMFTVFEERDRPAAALDYRRIFNHSVTVGMAAQLISKHLKLRFTDEIFLNGILHDLGYLVLNNYFSDEYRQVLELFEKEGFLIEAEKTVFDFTHADIGAWLAEKWDLPETILDVIRYHHNPSLAKKSSKRVACVHVADYIVSKGLFGVTVKKPDYPLDLSTLETLGIGQDYLETIEGKIIAGELL